MHYLVEVPRLTVRNQQKDVEECECQVLSTYVYMHAAAVLVTYFIDAVH